MDGERIQGIENTSLAATHFCGVLVQVLFCFVLCRPCFGTVSGIQCLKKLKASVDQSNKLDWTFHNNTEGSICGFNVVECWHPNENKVLALHLGGMGLKGQFPDGLENCSSMTTLDLSSNNLSGPIPADISKQLPFVTNLDLSYNSFSGQIPEALANCSYLNSVNLQHNKLTGIIPGQLAGLGRLAQFNVADNQLSGQIPSSLSTFPPSNFANQDLCGSPLSNCIATSNSPTGVIVGRAVGGAVITLIIVAVILFICLRKMPAKKEKDVEENKWAKTIKGEK